MNKLLQQTTLTLGLIAGISLSAYAQPQEGATGPHDAGPGSACAPAFGPGPQFGSISGPMSAPMHGSMPDLAPPPFLHKLDLSEAQQDKIFNIRLANAPLVREQEKLAHESGKELHSLLEQDQYDETKIKSLAEAQAHAVAQLEVLHARGMHQFLAVLTPEQKTKLNAMKEKFSGPHHGEEH